jgi:hypothetical protein
LEDLVLVSEGGVSVNIDSECDLENITDAELQERKCLFCSQNITTGTIIPPPIDQNVKNPYHISSPCKSELHLSFRRSHKFEGTAVVFM